MVASQLLINYSSALSKMYFVVCIAIVWVLTVPAAANGCASDSGPCGTQGAAVSLPRHQALDDTIAAVR